MRLQACILALMIPAAGCVAARTGSEAEPSAETSSTRSPQESLLAALAWYDGSGRVPPKVLISELERQRAVVGLDLREILVKTLALLRKYEQTPTAIGPQDRQQAGYLLARLAQIFPRDFEVQLATASGIHRLQTEIREEGNARVDNDFSPRSHVSRAEALAASFPSEARAYAHLASVLSGDNSRTMAAMRAYVKCAELDPRQKPCLAGFNHLADEWVKPRCASFKDQAFAVHPAYPKPSKALRRVSVSGLTLFMEPQSALTGKQIQEVMESTGEASGPTVANTLQIWLTPLAAGRFAELTRKLAEQSGYLVVRMGKDFIAAPRVMSGIDSGQLVLNASQPLPWRSMCTRFETRKLPADLAKKRL